MTNEEYIRKAVELADGWGWYGQVIDPPCPLNPIMQDAPIPQEYLDALAAQLVRQVDELPNIYIGVDSRSSRVYPLGDDDIILAYINSAIPNRTMNTIKAIVDSGVLE